MDRGQARRAGFKQLAIDYNAKLEDFQAGGVAITEAARLPGRRGYRGAAPFFEMVTVGHSTVIMADKRLHPALRAWAGGAAEPHWLFELPWLLSLSGILAPYGYRLTQTHHAYLPGGGAPAAAAPAGIQLEWLGQEGIGGLYPNSRWPNALQGEWNPARPDVLALAAMDRGGIVGMAGASLDAPGMWQIGIDVLPAYRGRGLGKALVQGLAAEVESRGAVPFYYASLSNIHSQSLAVGCGFSPAWVDVSAEGAQG